MHASSDRLGLGIQVAGFMAFVTGGSSDWVVPVHAVRFSKVLEYVA
jgi:hypothetical protein